MEKKTDHHRLDYGKYMWSKNQRYVKRDIYDFNLRDIDRHKCIICNDGYHKILDCPDQCKLCFGLHVMKEHECLICKNGDHGMENCPNKCSVCGDKWHLTEEHKYDF